MAPRRSADSSVWLSGASWPSSARAACTVSEADKDLALLLLHLDRAQPRGGIGRVGAGANVVLVAVPRADDVQLGTEVVAQAALVAVETLEDAVHQRALADRAAQVRAAVLPCVEPAVEAEDPDLGAVDVD